MKNLSSINEYMNMRVQTNAISLIFLRKDYSGSEFYSELYKLLKPFMDSEYVKLLETTYEENLLPEKCVEQANGEDSKVSDTSTKTSASKQVVENSSIKDKSGSRMSNSTEQGSQTRTPVQPNRKGVTQTPKGADTKRQTGPTESKTAPEESKLAVSTKPQEEAPEQPRATFSDILHELAFDATKPKKVIDSNLLEQHPEFKSIVEKGLPSSVSFSAYYYHSGLDDCIVCGHRMQHYCKQPSTSAKFMPKLQQSYFDKEWPNIWKCTATIDVLVSNNTALKCIDKRALGPESGTSLQPKPALDLDFCLEAMQKREDMGKDCLVDCTKCGNKTEREVCYILDQAPELFLIQLKRFKTIIDYKTGHTEKKKNSSMVELKETVQVGNRTYSLFGVVNHFGEIDKGHYTACVKKPDDGQWYLYDDEKVHKVSFKDVNADCAYLLFYTANSN